MKTLFKTRHFSSFQVIIFSFLAVILLGSLLLMLPIASSEMTWTPFSDALFTSTSAVCVTGLVVRDTATSWSLFGQIILLLLIQIGGLGVITIAISATILTGKKIGLMQRQTMQEAIGAPQVGGILRLTGFLLKSAFVFEGIGILLMLPVFTRDFGILKGIWYSIFHAVSAFCNAGFDLMGTREPFSSLTGYRGEPLINLAVMLLITIGGLGFLTWDDIRKNRYHFRRYRMQSKVILLTSSILVLIPTIYFFFFEFGNESIAERIWMSLFQSVTTRTAGFNTADLASMHDSGKVMMILLMLVGGSPGSTAGGMKTTTLAVLVLCAFAVFKRREHVHCFGRRLPLESIRNAAVILLLYLFLGVTGACIISYIETMPFLTAMFETASAIGTVGLTLGVTTSTCLVSRIILILLMFFGRVGALTLIYAAVSDPHQRGNHYPQERITVG